MTDMDADLATPLAAIRGVFEMYGVNLTPVNMLEAELSRLREQLDVRTEAHARSVSHYKNAAEAAEARCARLQQALEEIASTDFDESSDFSELGRIARAALAGPDTPAEEKA